MRIKTSLSLLAVFFAASLLAQGPVHYWKDGSWALPDSEVSPGVARTTDKSEICAPGFTTKKYRHTTEATKHKICAEYGITGNCPDHQYEIDHIISIEIGGADVPGNLWPQPLGQARVKDKLENRLHKLVCTGKMGLVEAQRCISTDWVSCMGISGK